MIKKNAKDLVPLFFDSTANSYDKIVRITTFGKDKFWKHKILDHFSTEKKVLDLACGTGILTRQIAHRLPNAKIMAVDITKNYLDKAKEKLALYQNVSFLNQDAEKLCLGTTFDCIAASYLPKYCIADILIKKCLEHLNTGGKIILHDFTYPKNRFVRKLWNFYFKLLYVLGFFIPHWRNVFVDLPNLIRHTNWVKDYEDAMKYHGLKLQKQNLTCGTSTILVGIKIT